VAIEEKFGTSLQSSALVECPTIERLAGRLEGTGEARSVVPLATGGSGAPLFLIHDGDGEVLLYRTLARRLAGGRAVYGVQPMGRPDVPIAHTRIEDMAAHYVEEIRKVRARGPYLLGGLCAAGILSFEVARQLEKAGEDARLVAVFDAADAEAAPRKSLVSRRRVGRLREALSAASLWETPGIVFRKATGYLGYELGRRTRGIVDRFSVATLDLCLRHDFPLPAWARGLPVRTVYAWAQARYRPGAKLLRQILLFRATEGHGADESFVNLYEDPLLGWGQRTRQGVRVIEAAGGHSSMLQEPHVSGLAEDLGRYLDDQDRDTENRPPPDESPASAYRLIRPLPSAQADP
jgi:thioesterase domain-containing protein